MLVFGDFLLLETRLGDGQEEGALEAVLFAVLTDDGLAIGKDITTNFATPARIASAGSFGSFFSYPQPR